MRYNSYNYFIIMSKTVFKLCKYRSWGELKQIKNRTIELKLKKRFEAK